MTALSKDQQSRLTALRQRAEADRSFAQAFENDPKGTLEANGISTEGLTFAGRAGNEVSGYMQKELPDNCICLWHNDLGECTVSFCR